MNINTWIKQALSLCLMVAVFATYSVNALATTPKLAGEIIVSGKTLGTKTSVKVNGSSIESGSSLFSSSSIITSENTDAVINVGKVGRVQLAPNTDLSLTFDEASFVGNLVRGKVDVLSASKSENVETTFNVENAGTFKLAPNTSASLTVVENGLVAELRAGAITSVSSTGNIVVKMPNGKTVNLASGETVNSQDEGNDDNGGGALWLFGIILGAAAVGILIVATTDNNRIALGGGGTVISPSQ